MQITETAAKAAIVAQEADYLTDELLAEIEAAPVVALAIYSGPGPRGGRASVRVALAVQTSEGWAELVDSIVHHYVASTYLADRRAMMVRHARRAFPGFEVRAFVSSFGTFEELAA